MKEIGSFYELNHCFLESGQKNISPELFSLKEVEKYNKKYTCYTSSGRDAILLAIRTIEKNHPNVVKKCLMPAYMCDSVFIPFELTGWELVFYHINQVFETEAKELQTLIEKHQPGVIFVHPYYGVDTCKNLWDVMEPYRKKGLLVMEDMTQSYYLAAERKMADYIIGSLRKWYAIPDGGFLVCDESIATEWVKESDDSFMNRRLFTMQSKYEYLSHGSGDKQSYLQDNRTLEHEMDQFTCVRTISGETMQLLSDIDESHEKEIRAKNYAYLNQNLANHIKYASISKSNQEENVGLYYPVYLEDRESIQRALIENQIYAPVLWPIGKQNEKELSQTEQDIFDHILALPMDQRYDVDDMERIVKVMKENC